jgi:hypothetical protein
MPLGRRPRLGLGISGNEVRAVLVHRGRIRWHERVAVVGRESLGQAISVLLSSRPPQKRSRQPLVVAAIGPDASQLRRVSGLPPGPKQTVVATIVRESTSRFFLVNGHPMVATDIALVTDDSAWAGAVEAEVVRVAADACARCHLGLYAVTPSAAILPLVSADSRLMWPDATHAWELGNSRGSLDRVRRLPISMAERVEPPTQMSSELATLANDAWKFADAYAAAIVSLPVSLSHKPAPVSLGWQAQRASIVACVGALAISGAAFAMSPMLVAQYEARHAESELRLLRPQWQSLGREQHELDSISRLLHATKNFFDSRHQPLELLAQLTQQLSDSSSILALHIDTIGGTIAIISSRAASSLSELKRVTGIDRVEILGAVASETLNGERRERATLRFAWASTPTQSPHAAVRSTR